MLVGTETFEPPHAPGRHHDHPHHASANDLVGVGFARSMARHGGNVTGVSILATELDAKRLEILRAALPSAKLIGLIADPGNSAERHPGRRCRVIVIGARASTSSRAASSTSAGSGLQVRHLREKAVWLCHALP